MPRSSKDRGGVDEPSPNSLVPRHSGLFRIGEVGVETALRYARIVAHLRRSKALAGRSKPDLWIAAWAAERSASLVTRNAKRFQDVPGLHLIAYGA